MTIEELQALTDDHFEGIVTDGLGNVVFGVPIPGHPELEYELIQDEGYGLRIVRPLTTDSDFPQWKAAWTEYLEKLSSKPQTYRTRKKAEAGGAIVSMPERLAIPTMDPYQHSLTVIENPAAHLQPITKELADRLRFENGVLYFDGIDASRIELEGYSFPSLVNLYFFYMNTT